jgi:hypothetical protein
MENEIMTIEEFKEYTGLDGYELEWWESHGLFRPESDLGIDPRWKSVWDYFQCYLNLGFQWSEALMRSRDHVFGEVTYESFEEWLELFGE